MRLYHAVAFDEPISVSDGQGGREEGWQERHACRANFRNLRGSEVVIGARLSGVQPVVVMIRANSSAVAINTDWRMRDERSGDVYNIRSIVTSDNRLYREITAERGVAV